MPFALVVGAPQVGRPVPDIASNNQLVATFTTDSRNRLSGGSRSGTASRGSPQTQEQLDKVRDEFLRRNPDFTHLYGGTDRLTGLRLKEEYIPGPGGGRKGSTRPDLTFQGPGLTVRVNTVDTTASGTMTQRELENFGKLLEQGPAMAVPKCPTK
jgi:hypothetical protein